MILVQQTVRIYHRFMLLTINFRDECTNIAKIDGIVSDIIIQLTRSLLTITESCIQMCCKGLMMKYLVQFACENGVSFKKKIFKLRNDTAGTRPGLGTTYRLSRSFFFSSFLGLHSRDCRYHCSSTLFYLSQPRPYLHWIADVDGV